MDNKRKKILTSTIMISTVFGGASLTANTGPAFSYNDLGSGSEIRTTLVSKNISQSAGVFSLEQSCGEGKVEAKTKSKSKEAKCGAEGDKKDAKSAEKKDAKPAGDKKDKKKSENKSAEAKCGEATCGK